MQHVSNVKLVLFQIHIYNAKFDLKQGTHIIIRIIYEPDNIT